MRSGAIQLDASISHRSTESRDKGAGTQFESSVPEFLCRTLRDTNPESVWCLSTVVTAAVKKYWYNSPQPMMIFLGMLHRPFYHPATIILARGFPVCFETHYIVHGKRMHYGDLQSEDTHLLLVGCSVSRAVF